MTKARRQDKKITTYKGGLLKVKRRQTTVYKTDYELEVESFVKSELNKESNINPQSDDLNAAIKVALQYFQQYLEPDDANTILLKYIKAIQAGYPIKICMMVVLEVVENPNANDLESAFDEKIKEYSNNLN